MSRRGSDPAGEGEAHGPNQDARAIGGGASSEGAGCPSFHGGGPGRAKGRNGQAFDPEGLSGHGLEPAQARCSRGAVVIVSLQSVLTRSPRLPCRKCLAPLPLPEVAQPIVVGMAVSLPVIGVVVVLLRPASEAPVARTEPSPAPIAKQADSNQQVPF